MPPSPDAAEPVPSPHPELRVEAWSPDDPMTRALADAGLGVFEIDLQARQARGTARLFDLLDLEAPSADATARMHAEDRSAWSAALAAAVAAGAGAAYAVDCRVARRDGASCWLAWRGRVTQDPDAAGEPVLRLVGVVRDDTPQREAAAIEQRRDRFLSLLAHDLRNPLAPLHTAAELMRRAEMQPARITAISDMLGRQVTQMAHLIDDLVDVSRAGQGKLELKRRTLDVGSVIEQAVASVRPFVERRRQTIETEFEEPAPMLSADPERLVQILTHLLEHASRSSTEDALIRVGARRVGAEVLLEVADDGAGIEPGRLGQVFDLYPPAEVEPGRRQALGLGLALVKALATLHGGSAEAASAGPGQGATYTIRLPA